MRLFKVLGVFILVMLLVASVSFSQMEHNSPWAWGAAHDGKSAFWLLSYLYAVMYVDQTDKYVESTGDANFTAWLECPVGQKPNSCPETGDLIIYGQFQFRLSHLSPEKREAVKRMLNEFTRSNHEHPHY